MAGAPVPDARIAGCANLDVVRSYAKSRASSVSPFRFPSTLATYALATVSAGKPLDASRPMASRVSLTHGGLTTLMRAPRGISSAADLAKASSPALTSVIAEPPGTGYLAQQPARQRERSALADVRQARPDEIHLPHELVRQAEVPVRVRKLRERPELHPSHRGHESVEGAERLQQALDRPLVPDVHLVLAPAVPDPHHLMPPLERPDDGLPDGPRGPDNDDSHANL